MSKKPEKPKTDSWKILIDRFFDICDDKWENVISCTLTEEQLNKKFNAGYGVEEGRPFTIWTKDHVYFPSCYDGSEDVARVSRNPDGEPTSHVGGG
jgi:hypothetical protein